MRGNVLLFGAWEVLVAGLACTERGQHDVLKSIVFDAF